MIEGATMNLETLKENVGQLGAEVSRLYEQRVELDLKGVSSAHIIAKIEVFESDLCDAEQALYEARLSHVARFAGTQIGYGDVPSFKLYNLVAPGHPLDGSTVSEQHALDLGFALEEQS